jgi:hypothetical protein
VNPRDHRALSAAPIERSVKLEQALGGPSEVILGVDAEALVLPVPVSVLVAVDDLLQVQTGGLVV